jgi:16S rRNA (cytosine967-C5)-methyltransferase
MEYISRLAIDLAKLDHVSPARLAAFEILRRVEDGAFSSVVLAAKEEDLNAADGGLCHELVLGVLRWQSQLDKIIEYYADRKVNSLDLGVRLALRLGLYQLRFLTRVPASAAVNESVNLVGHARLRSAQGLVNAVLRRATRERDYDPAAGISDPIEEIAVQTSHPVWLIQRWVRSFGIEETRSFAQANNQTPPTALRIVHSRANESDLLTKLRSAGATVEPSPIAPGAWRVSDAQSLLRQLASVGEVYLQDEASQLVAGVLEPQAGQQVLDLCAAPGGKTTQIADLVRDRALIVAADLSPRRLNTVAKTSMVQQLTSIKCLVLDATRPLPFPAGVFDRVLVDAPCSGTGTLRHNPEIRWRISADDIQSLSARQKQLLLNAASVVKPGGRLIYSTCSVELDENEEVVSSFLGRDGRFRLIRVPVDSSLLTQSGSARTWPQRHGSDGFFIAAFERKK